ncbi:MAG: hypothetical protein AAGD13_13825 [Pseudomonadota bacterium]
MEEDVIVEIERLHAFLSGWFRGEYAHEAFEQGFANSLHEEFERVQPSGISLTRSTLLDAVGEAHGASPDFRITIAGARLIAAYPGVLLATYEEHQTGARNSAARNHRRSTVLFEAGKRLIWRYVHETPVSG